MKEKIGFQAFFHLLISTKIPKVTLAIGLIGTIVSTLIGLAIPYFTAEIVDGFSLELMSKGVIVAVVIAFLLQAVTDGLSLYLLAKVGHTIVAKLREMLWSKIIKLPVSYFDKVESGKTVSRVVNDTSVVKDLISQHFPQFIGGMISIIGAVIILLIMDWKMTLIMLISVPLTMAFMIPLGNQMVKVSRSLQDETATFTSTIQQAIHENRLMKASTSEEVEHKNGLLGIKRLYRFGLKEAKINALVMPIMYTIVMIVIVFIIGYGGIRVAEGSMTTGSLVAFLLYLFQIVFPITSIGMFFTQLQKTKGATERIVEILQLSDENGQTGLHVDISDKRLQLLNVSFRYHPDEPIIKNVSFEAKPGEMIAIVGPSGSGKTTIFGLIERFYEPVEGEIKIGDFPIQSLSLNSWRSQIGYVAQESAMMAGTIRENLCYGLTNSDEITDEQLWEVAKMTFSDEFIKNFKDGLNTVVGERGVKLSGGQRQRIAIARAFLRDPKILLLDEATASLDSESESIVQEALYRLMKGRTTLVIAHRLSTIVDADKIIFLDKGKVTGMGTHEELYASHPLYRKYCENQLT